MNTELDIIDAEVEDPRIVMPFYIILDLSGSMAGDFPAMEKELSEIIRGVT